MCYYRWRNTMALLLPPSLSQPCRYHLQLSFLSSAWLKEGNVEKTDLQPSAGLVQNSRELVPCRCCVSNGTVELCDPVRYSVQIPPARSSSRAGLWPLYLGLHSAAPATRSFMPAMLPLGMDHEGLAEQLQRIYDICFHPDPQGWSKFQFVCWHVTSFSAVYSNLLPEDNCRIFCAGETEMSWLTILFSPRTSYLCTSSGPLRILYSLFILLSLAYSIIF